VLDVQLTKDHVPVIYHDFLVSETGIDAPVHTLTLEQVLSCGQSVAYGFADSSLVPTCQRCSIYSTISSSIPRPSAKSGHQGHA
jgi:glycerophosphoryl diester phosphodiesterase